MGLNFTGSPVNLDNVTAKVPTPTYSGVGNPGDPEATNPYTGDGPVVIGDPYWNNVTFLMQANTLTLNTTGGQFDASNSGHTIGNAGGAVTAITTPVADRAFMFSGFEQYMYFPHSADTVFAAGEDYTIEFWIKQTGGGSRRAMSVGDFAGNSGGLILFSSSPATPAVQLDPDSNSAQTWNISGSVGGSAWQHFALTNYNDTRTTWLDGVVTGTPVFDATGGPPLQGTTSYVMIAASDHYSPNNDGQVHEWEPIEGFMDQVRITKGVARYTAAFDVPTEPFDTF